MPVENYNQRSSAIRLMREIVAREGEINAATSAPRMKGGERFRQE